MQFQPKSEEQIARESLLDPGVYDFEIMDAEDKVSKKGNDMIKLSIKTFRPDGGFVYVTDYLLASMEFKLVHFAKTCGILKLYESGKMTAADCKGLCGKVKLEIEEQTGYAPKNVVKDYVKPALGMSEAAPVAAKPLIATHHATVAVEDEPPF